MNALPVLYLKTHSPYDVDVMQNGDLQFTTEYGVEYRVSFMEDYSIWPENAYQFLINNKNKKSSPSDIKLKETIMAIIEAFFISNPYILLYICETGDDKQAARNRLFVRWFNDAKHQKEYYFRNVNIKAEGIDNFAAIIVQKSNPEIETIISQFDEFVNLMIDKPE